MLSKMPLLFIFIPTFNRQTRLRFCLERVFAELTGHESEVRVHVSDNASTDGTAEYLSSLSHPCFSFSRNEFNVGGAKNITKVHEHSSIADYSLVLGDDDYLVAGAIPRLIRAIRLNPDLDVLFLNSIAYEENESARILPILAASGFSQVSGGSLKSKITESFRCGFGELINPRIDEVLGGSLMCYAFRSKVVSDSVSEMIRGVEFGGIYSSYPHTLNLIRSLSPSAPAIHLAEPYTFNFWHQGAEWGKLTYHRVVTQGLGFVFFELERLGYLTKESGPRIFSHYLSIALPSLEQLLKDSQSRSEAVLDAKFMELLLSRVILSTR